MIDKLYDLDLLLASSRMSKGVQDSVMKLYSAQVVHRKNLKKLRVEAQVAFATDSCVRAFRSCGEMNICLCFRFITDIIGFFVFNTNLIFLYKIDIEDSKKFQEKIKLPPVGFELTTGLEF